MNVNTDTLQSYNNSLYIYDVQLKREKISGGLSKV